MAKILVVGRDIKSSQLAGAVAEGLMAKGHTIYPVLEGKIGTEAFFSLTKNKLVPYFCALGEVGTFSINPRATFKELKPELVVVGLSWPINLENLFALEANRQKVPLVMLDALGGDWVRTNAAPDLFLTISEEMEKLAKEVCKCETSVIGYACLPSEKPFISERVKQQMEELHKRYDTIIVFGDYGLEATLEQIELFCACLKKTPGKWCVILRTHPKWDGLKVPGCEITYTEFWRSLLQKEVGNSLVSISDAPNSDSIVALADLTVSGGSSIMETAAITGKKVLSLRTPKTLTMRREVTGLEEYPLVRGGVIPEVGVAIDLSKVPLPSAEKLALIKPFNKETAVKAVLNFMLRRSIR